MPKDIIRIEIKHLCMTVLLFLRILVLVLSFFFFLLSFFFFFNLITFWWDMANYIWNLIWLSWCNFNQCYTKLILFFFFFTLFDFLVIYIDGFKLHYSIFFNWIQILTNSLLDYIIFVHSPYLQNFKMIKYR